MTTNFATRVYTHSPPFSQAIAVGMIGSLACSGVITSYIRSIGDDYGGSSVGQPKTTSYEWRDQTKKYLKQQRANPIRNHDGREFL